MSKKYTLADIAAEIGVSAVTVSKALSGQKGVSDEMRERIIQKADEMGYRRTEHRIRQRDRITLGVIVAERYLEESQSYYWKLYQDVVLETAAKKGFAILEVIDAKAEENGWLPKTVTEGQVQGLVVLGDFHQNYRELLVRDADIPLAALDTSLGEDCDAVAAANITGGAKMTDYLCSLGHQKIGFVGTRLATRSIDERFLGYFRSLMEHGIEYRPELLVDDRSRETGRVEIAPYFHISDEDMPTAFFCNCDLTAALLTEYLRSRNLRVPEDISVVGFDNYTVDLYQNAEITTYEIDRKKMAAQAVGLLLNRMKQPDRPVENVWVGGRFIEKNSAVRVGPPVPPA